MGAARLSRRLDYSATNRSKLVALTPQAETGSMELMETIFFRGKLRFHLSGVEGLEVLMTEKPLSSLTEKPLSVCVQLTFSC